MTKKWQIYETNEQTEKKIKELEEKEQINKLLATILVNRNMTDHEQLKVFLYPTRKDFHDPYLMPDMRKAVDRIKQAIENGKINQSRYDRYCKIYEELKEKEKRKW